LVGRVGNHSVRADAKCRVEYPRSAGSMDSPSLSPITRLTRGLFASVLIFASIVPNVQCRCAPASEISEKATCCSTESEHKCCCPSSADTETCCCAAGDSTSGANACGCCGCSEQTTSEAVLQADERQDRLQDRNSWSASDCLVFDASEQIGSPRLIAKEPQNRPPNTHNLRQAQLSVWRN